MLGPPCSGKGTHSQLISESFGLKHVSTGNLFRNEIERMSPIGIIAKQLIDFGNFVPDSVTMKIFYLHIQSNPSDEGYLLDGFPRTLPQAEFLSKYLAKHLLNIDLVFYLYAPEEVLLARMGKRSLTENRADDNSNAFMHRIENYYKNTHVLTDYYSAQEKLVSISTDNSIAEVSRQILEVVEAKILEKK